jgi:3-dehydroquinate synthase
MKITIESNIRNYDVVFENTFDFLNDFSKIKNSILIIDRNVFELYSDKFGEIKKEDLFLFDAIEENKTFDYVKEIYDFLISKSVKRNLTIVSVGGGITQDITGFVASTLYRGVKWIFVPTTFLAITDSCIGSKTSLNYEKYKNLMGTFYPPNKIHINTEFLSTLKELDFFSGIGETIKFQLMKEEYPKNLSRVLEMINKAVHDSSSRLDIIHDNMNVKLGYMKGDEFDLGRRNLLNYGHCFGHALETSSDYYVPHGIAVNIGMIFANILSVNRSLLSEKESDFVNQNILLPNIPLALREQDFNHDVLLEAMKNDKKRVGKYLTVIIPDGEFKMLKVDDVTDDEYKNALNDLTLFCLNKEGDR